MINKAILLGRLGADPDVRTVGNEGKKVARVRLATTESYKPKNGDRKEQTEWHTINFWSPLAEVVEKYLRKGALIYAEGRIQIREYTDNEGTKRFATEIQGSVMKMCSSRNEEAPRNEAPAPKRNDQNYDILDDLPF